MIVYILYVETVNQPQVAISEIIQRTVNHQMPPHLTYIWTCWTAAYNQSRSRKCFFLTGNSPIPGFHLLLPALCIVNISSFKTTYHFSSPNSLYIKEPCQPQDGRLSSHLASCCCFRLHAPGCGPFLASIWLKKPFLSGQLLAPKVFV